MGQDSEGKASRGPYNVMTVCTGNICRSPMAEVILRKFFQDRGLDEDQVRVESSGVSDEEFGNPIDRRAQKVLRERGYEVPADHFAHRITREEAEDADLLLPMTADHMRALLRLLPSGKRSAVHLYRSFDPTCPSRHRDGRAKSIWWTLGMAAPMSSRWPSIRSSTRRPTSSTGWPDSCPER